jgi:hypothetical protein
LTPIIGAVFVFIVVFLFVDFFAMHMVEGAPRGIELAGLAGSVLIAFVFAASSYRASLRVVKKKKAANSRS